MAETEFQIGDDLYVREPATHFPCATCIVGPVVSINSDGTLTLDACVAFGRMGRAYPNQYMALAFRPADLDWRRGTPISQLSGRPGHAGYDRFKQIAASWGFD